MLRSRFNGHIASPWFVNTISKFFSVGNIIKCILIFSWKPWETYEVFICRLISRSITRYDVFTTISLNLDQVNLILDLSSQASFFLSFFLCPLRIALFLPYLILFNWCYFFFVFLGVRFETASAWFSEIIASPINSLLIYFCNLQYL